jgi:hypothetical protein
LFLDSAAESHEEPSNAPIALDQPWSWPNGLARKTHK